MCENWAPSIQCQECGFFAYFKRALKDHKRKHKTHSCSQCNYKVKSKVSLKRHIETRHTHLMSLEGLESLLILDKSGQQSGNESKENLEKCKEEEDRRINEIKSILVVFKSFTIIIIEQQL